MKKMPAIFDLVVMNREPDATLYRVKGHGVRQVGLKGRLVGVIDATIEAKRPNQRVQWVDLSLVQQPTKEQLAGFNK